MECILLGRCCPIVKIDALRTGRGLQKGGRAGARTPWKPLGFPEPSPVPRLARQWYKLEKTIVVT